MEEKEASAEPSSETLGMPDGLEAVSPDTDGGVDKAKPDMETNGEPEDTPDPERICGRTLDELDSRKLSESDTEIKISKDSNKVKDEDEEVSKQLATGDTVDDELEKDSDIVSKERIIQNNIDSDNASTNNVDDAYKDSFSTDSLLNDGDNVLDECLSNKNSDSDVKHEETSLKLIDAEPQEVRQNGPEEGPDKDTDNGDEEKMDVDTTIDENSKLDDSSISNKTDTLEVCSTDDKNTENAESLSVDSHEIAESSIATKISKDDQDSDNHDAADETNAINLEPKTEENPITEDGSLDQDKDDRGNPQFEDAPEPSTLDTSREGDLSQVLDPFDELLKGAPTELDTNTSHLDASKEFNIDNDDHELGMDDSMTMDEEHNDVADETLVDDVVADVNEGQGADEEICLLPDTEREISEADKLKALAAKKPKETDSSSMFDSILTDSSAKESGGGDAVMTVLKGEISDEAMETSTVEGEHNNIHGDGEGADDESFRDSTENKEDEEHLIEEELKENVIQEVCATEETCVQCSNVKMCSYRLIIESETKHLCGSECIKHFQESTPSTYTMLHKKVYIKEITSTEETCLHCSEIKSCTFEISGDPKKYICLEKCLNDVIGEEKEKYVVSRKKKFVQEINEMEATCHICSETKGCSYEVTLEGEHTHICNQQCLTTLQESQPNTFKIKKRKTIKVKQPPLLKLSVISNATDKYLDEGNKVPAKTPEQIAAARADRDRSFMRKCAQCNHPHLGNDKNLSWETMDFCNEACLGKYQNSNGSHCANCKNEVSLTSLGKYCVRFGYDIRQFCCSSCLEEFKKGLKICCYCQRDISVGYEGFLAPVGDKGQFKDFCSQFCVEKFDQMSKNPVPPPVWAQCAVCSKEKPTQLEVAIDDKKSLRLCSEPCFAAFKFVNHVFPDQCRWCNKYFERTSAESYTIYTDNATHCFCTKACMNVYISNSRHIVPCNWCKVKKYNFDMIKRTLANGQSMMMCSLNCLTLYQVSVNAVSSRRIKCDQCKRTSQAQYHLTMSDATVRNFCTYQCVMSFQGQYSKTPLMVEGDAHPKQAVPTGAPRRTLNSQRASAKNQKMMDQRSGMPVIASVQSLAAPPSGPAILRGKSKRNAAAQERPREPTPPPPPPPKPLTPPPPPPPKIYNHVIIKPALPKEVKNMSTMTKPIMVSKGVTCRPHPCTKECQTDDSLQRRILIPIPIPIYVPVPVAMYSLPFPVPVPIPLPIPVPVFIPTTRNSSNGIMKEIKKIHEKMPTDPFEAELLMMAEMVAGDKKKAESDSESEEDPADEGFSPEGMDAGNSAFGEDVLQMALKMATEYEEPAVDLESAMTASTITPSSHPSMPAAKYSMDENTQMHHHQLMLLEQQRAAAAAAGRKRGARPPPPGPAPVQARTSKRPRRNPEPTPPPLHAPEPPREPQEKPDANMCLKYTFGVNAWKQWVMTKNAEMEKSTVRRKPFKSEILQLTADELNYSLCLFVKEVRKPNGSEYAPDTIYYLVLGIQQYLFENGRIDNIFTDSYYEKFTECLDEVARKFSVLYNDSQYIVTRVEEEHLWESKQLGAHSPHVLLSTLMFFNTKHFNLVTVEEHMQLSFSHIMKHWKRNPNQPGAAKVPGSRNVLLRFYPPQAALEANSRKKKVYEQQENEDNPLRCPVKLYEFYLSKCPESVKTRNDVFYLMPERSCVPDSPVWYSTQALGREPLSKMLHRVKMVKEINIALLTS